MSEKTGINLYYSYEHEEFAEMTLEEVGALVLGCLAYDQGKDIREDAKAIIESDRAVRTAFREMKTKTQRASDKWHEINNNFEKSRLLKDIMTEYNCTKEEAKEILKKLKENSSIVSSDVVSDTPVIVSDNSEMTFGHEYIFKIKEQDPSLPFSDDTFEIIAECLNKYEDNLPNQKEVQETLDELSDETEKDQYINHLFNNGNEDGWKKNWIEYCLF